MNQMQNRRSKNIAKYFFSMNGVWKEKIAKMPLKQRIDEIKLFQRDANSLFQRGFFSKDLTKYESALTYYGYYVCNGCGDETMLEDIRMRCLLNERFCCSLDKNEIHNIH